MSQGPLRRARACRRWNHVTAKLIAAKEDRGLLSGPDLDELAASLLSDGVSVVSRA